MILFNKEWFKKHQKILLVLSNTGIGRYILRINGGKSCVGDRTIIRIDPNAITWELDSSKKLYQTEFRTHNKFSKRLFYTLYPVLWLVHQWDMLFANNFRPAWNLGLDTLTAYPDPHTETSTVDGDTRYADTVAPYLDWASLLAAAGTSATDSDTTFRIFVSAHPIAAGYDNCWRAIHLYDTSALGAGATIDSAVCSFVSNSVTNAWTDSVSLCASAPASNTAIVSGDHVNYGSTDFGNKTLASVTANGSTYNDITVNASGLAAISKTGITKFGYRLTRDLTGTDPSAEGNSNITFFAAEQTGTSTDPKLVVTYTASDIKKVSGVAYASIGKVSGVAKASVKKIIGVA